MGRTSILVFTKNPARIPSKTRLRASSTLDDPVIDALSAAFVVDTFSSVMALSSSPVFIASDPLTTAADWRNLAQDHELQCKDSFLDGAVFLMQRGDSFTSRLQNALRDVSRSATGGILVLGSDSPMLPPAEIARALVSVELGRFVVGPSLSGGLYCIGIPGNVIERITDSLGGVFNQQGQSELERLSEIAVSLGSPLDIRNIQIDVDTEDDLASVIAILKADEHASYSDFTQAAAATRQVIARHALALSRAENNNRTPRVISSN